MITKFKIFLESVADKYVDIKYGTDPEFRDFDKKYSMMYYKPKEIYRDNNYKNGTLAIIKNPLSLTNIGYWSRGIIDSKGDLYIEVEPITIHDRILKILSNLGIIHTYIVDPKKLDENTKKMLRPIREDMWSWMLWRKKGLDEFITVQREANTNIMKIGECDKKSKNKDILLKKAKDKNPRINFSNEIIGETPNLTDMGKGRKYAF